MKRQRAILGAVLLAGLIVLVVLERRNATAPITPRPLFYLIADTERELERLPLELTRISTDDENQIGQELATRMAWRFPKPGTPEGKRIAEYVASVGARVAANVERKGIRYRFHYADDARFVNAFSMPGGQVVFGRGLLELLETEDELAAILAHEIAHVDARHCIERIQYELHSRKLGLRGLYRLGRPAILIFQAGYHKEKEAEADRLGIGLAVAAGYSPAGAIEVMQRFERYQALRRQPASPVEELLAVPLQSLQEYFRSHPPPRDRIAIFEKEIAARGWDRAQAQRPIPVRAVFLAKFAAKLDGRGLFDRAVARYEEVLRLDPEYLPARTGIVRAKWRAGDADGTAAAAEEVLLREPNAVAMWELLAMGLSVARREEAPRRYISLFEALSQRKELKLKADTILAVRVHHYGLEVFAGHAPPDAKTLWREVAGRLNAQNEAELRRQLAWWFYRAGYLKEPAKQLETARQRYPVPGHADIDLAWVFSDLARQADAQALAARVAESDEALAVRALIAWRSDQRDAAVALFRGAVERDPVWKEPRWVANNFPSHTAAVLDELRKAEMEQRQREADRRAGRIPARKRPQPR